MTQQKSFLIALVLLLNLIACKQIDKQSVAEKKVDILQTDDTNPENILAALETSHGGWNHLRSKKDVKYHYEYTMPSGDADISTERYLFDNEISFGQYTRHEINTLTTENGMLTHLFDGEKTKVTLSL